MKKLSSWMIDLWNAVDGRKRDIAGLISANAMIWLAAWSVPATHWVHRLVTCVCPLLQAVATGHAAIKGDLLRNNSTGGTP
jgi:hypothetical protein